MLCQYQHLFASPTGDYRFLTFKGVASKHQKIGFVSDLCRKVSGTFIVVRERNKKSEGYHFHAIMMMQNEPPKSWFKKGIHMNLQRIGKNGNGNGNVIPDIMNAKECMDACQTESGKEMVETQIMERAFAQSHRAVKHRDAVGRVLSYMEKEMEYPSQYTDYVFYLRGKSVALAIPQQGAGSSRAEAPVFP